MVQKCSLPKERLKNLHTQSFLTRMYVHCLPMPYWNKDSIAINMSFVMSVTERSTAVSCTKNFMKNRNQTLHMCANKTANYILNVSMLDQNMYN